MNLKAAVLGVARSIQRFVPTPPGHGVVLCYHLVGASTVSEVDLDWDCFRRHLDWLQNHAEVVSLGAILRPGRCVRVALTFDDGFLNFRERAWPELLARGLPATLFVPTGFVDGEISSPLSGVGLPACTWDDLRCMRAEGLAIGSHTHRHPNLRRLSQAEVEAELRIAQQRLCEELGAPAEDFCYPQAKHSPAVVRAVGRHHTRAVVGQGRHVSAGTPPLKIPRIPVRARQHDVSALFRRGLWVEEWLSDLARQYR